MRLSAKHTNQSVIERYDFSGGLNTSTAIETIAENQLAEVVNMELESSTGMLKTVSGTIDILSIADKTIFAAMHDLINHKCLLVTTDFMVYVTDFLTVSKIGALSGRLYPICAAWEDGLLVASGGQLQYYNGTTFVTIATSPAVCNGVYIKSGRVLIYYDNEIHYSGVGDETNWTDDSNDSSSSKFIEAGYKDGGNFIGMANLSRDIIIIKNNKRIYRLSGDYPDWSINQISSNLDCSGRLSFCAIQDSVLILGDTEVQSISTTDYYGDMKPTNLATNIGSEISKLPQNAILKFIPPLSQVWFIGLNGRVLIYDITHNCWFVRQFNATIIDVIPVGDSVYIVKTDRISLLKPDYFYDNGVPLKWKFKSKRLVSQYDFLIKRVQISVMPHFDRQCTAQIQVGGILLDLPMPQFLSKVYGNKTKIYKCRTKVKAEISSRGIYAAGDKVYNNRELIYANTQKIFSVRDITKEVRNVYRGKTIDVKGYGSAGAFVLNKIIFDVAEV